MTGRVGQRHRLQCLSAAHDRRSLTLSSARKLRVTGKQYKLALTQEHWALEGRGGDLTREATLSDYKADA